jgi:sulfonate transport system permease protein
MAMNRSGLTWFRPEARRGLVVPALIVITWALAYRFDLVNQHILPPPLAVWRTAVEQVRSGALWADLQASLARDLVGFALGTALGLVVGAAMGLSRFLDKLLGPTFHAAKQVALFAWVPLLSAWIGTGEPSKIVFIALSAFYPVVLNTYEGVRSIGVDYVEVARVFRFTRSQLLRRVILPAAAPSIFSGIQQALIYAWLGTLGAEYLLSSAPAVGLGSRMVEGRERLAMDLVLLGVIMTGLVGFGFNTLAAAVEGRALRWRVRDARTSRG